MPGQAGAAGPRDIAMVASALTQIEAPAIIAAAGTTQATATPLTRMFNIITSGSGGVVLPATPTVPEVVVNNRIGAMSFYPPLGAKIDSGAVNAAVTTLATGVKRFVCGSATQWWSAS